MSNITWLLGSLAIIISTVVGWFVSKKMASTDHSVLEVPVVAPESPQEAVTVSNPQVTTPTVPQASTGQIEPNWSTPKAAWHSVRVLCDSAGLNLEEKNLLCACIYQESQFLNTATHKNFVGGVLSSTDWGLCQINDWWHVTKYHDFPSAEFIVNNPDKAVAFMIDAYKNGGLSQWVSYSSGAYRQWLSPGSKMWMLAQS